MPRLVLLVGTRKGCFVLESDGDRRDWKVRGPFCDGWPIYHAVHDPMSGALYAAAASEWHGAGVWRSTDLGETWTLSSEGLTHSDPELKLSKISGLDGGARAAPRRHGGGRHLREPRRRRDLGAAQHTRRPARARRLERPRQAAAGAPRAAGDPAPPGRALALLGRHPGVRDLRDDGRRRLVDAAQPRAPRRLAARGSRGRLLRPQARHVAGRPRAHVPAEPLRHAPERRRRALLVGDHRRAPTDFGFAAAAHPHDRESFYVIPLDPGHGRCMPEGRAAVWRTSDGGSSWRRLDSGLPAARCASRRAPRGHGDRLARRPRPLLRDEHGAGLRERGRGRELGRDRRLPARRSRRSKWRCWRSHGRRAPALDAAAALPRAAAAARRRRRERR